MSAAPFTLKMMRMAGRWSACMFPTLDLAVGPKHSSTISSSLSTRGREGRKEDEGKSERGRKERSEGGEGEI